MVELELEDIQGFVLSGYAAMRYARYLLLSVEKPATARAWLAGLSDRVTTGVDRKDDWCVNVAITQHGLRALGLPPEDLQTFPATFLDGMVAPYRQRILGDFGASAPAAWRWGGAGPSIEYPGDQLHILLLLFASDEGTLNRLEESEKSKLTKGGGLRVVLPLTPEPLRGKQVVGRDSKFGVEHFGFADGMSQPVIEGSGQEHLLTGEDAARTVIAAGEFVLGYENGYGQLTPSPRMGILDGNEKDLGRNGTYLVVRELAQDVPGFNRFLEESTSNDAGTSRTEAIERLAAKLVGRWRSGAPLVRSAHRDDTDLATDNSFGYRDLDPQGDRCPIGAHIRRANPRDSLGAEATGALKRANQHRILRRGRVFGSAFDETDPDAGERGLIFMCINANIERQFEFIQQNWCNNPKFAGLYSEQDPILGSPPDTGGTFTIQGLPISAQLGGLRSFVTTRGGAYFFLPGISGLRKLSTAGSVTVEM
jgi:Dyp-type peroxidase family